MIFVSQNRFTQVPTSTVPSIAEILMVQPSSTFTPPDNFRRQQTITDRQKIEIDANRTVDNVEVIHEKQEPLKGDCTDTGHNAQNTHNVNDSLFDVMKHELRSENPEIVHQRNCNVDTLASITDLSFEDLSPGHMEVYSKSEPAQTAVNLPADFALDTSLTKEHTTTEDLKMDEVSSVKQNDIKPRTQQTLNKDKHTDNREMNREDGPRGGSVARRGVTHTGETLFSCHHCLYKTGYRRPFVIHMRKHTGEKPYKCKHCDFKCSERSNLKKHMRSHTGVKPHSCEYCDYKCSQSGNLKSHMRTHTGEKPYSCEYCDYKCSQGYQIKSHTRTHTGEKPNCCKYCNYKCSRASVLKIHIRSHTGEKPYVCKYCVYKCSVGSQLIRHTRIHTGEKPFSCNHCDYKCSSSNCLKKHMKKQHS